MTSTLKRIALEHSNVLVTRLILGGAKFHSLLRAHHLLDAYFLTIESVCLLTRLYVIEVVGWVVRLIASMFILVVPTMGE